MPDMMTPEKTAIKMLAAKQVALLGNLALSSGVWRAVSPIENKKGI
jgi:hypothetical protein